MPPRQGYRPNKNINSKTRKNLYYMLSRLLKKRKGSELSIKSYTVFIPTVKYRCKGTRISKNLGELSISEKILILCPFAVYYLHYAVRSFFTMSRISLADSKRAGQKVQRKIAVAVQKVKPLYFLSRSFQIREKYCQQSFFLFESSNCPRRRDGGFRGGGIRDGEIGEGEIEEGGCE